MKLRILGHKLKPTQHHRLTLPQKVADRELQTPEHKAWRLIVCRRAGWQCEAILSDGARCSRSAANGDRMIADHIVERADGGALYDPDNGQCLCTPCNTAKGTQARGARARG